MILFFGEGRLGNQIFQLRWLRSIRAENEPVLAIGLERVYELFELESGIYPLRLERWTKRLVMRLLIPLLVRPLAHKLRLCRYVREAPFDSGTPGDGSGLAIVRTGLIRRLTVVDGGFYQAAVHWPTALPGRGFIIRTDRRAAALEKRARLAPSRPAAFVHVRRTDYATWSAYGATDVVLPAHYYLEGIRTILRCLPTAQIIVVTDDAEWASKHILSEWPEAVIARGTEMEDFCLMQACDAGVVSNSTFSLAAALLMDAPACVVAPRYWLGFRIGRWLPPRIQFANPRIQYIDVGAA